MLRLLSLTLINIGPFRDQTRTIDFHSGSFLVKAPIGSGKSFLYFDGPTFALYNKKSRQMLNMHCDKGQVLCSFEIDHHNYTIQREITKTKTGESIKSKLFVSKEIGQISVQTNASQTLDSANFLSSELIDFKNESDLQQMLNSLLPPLEVFLGTQMLMQDSTNIFELGPKDRLEILKNVFGLLGIDDAKERINERRREISAIIKARADTSQYNEKAKHLIGQLISQRSVFDETVSSYDAMINRKKTLDEWILLQDKITIDELHLPQRPDFGPILNDIDRQHNKLITLQSQQQSLQAQELQLNKQQNDVLKQASESEQLLSSYQIQLKKYDPSHIQHITEDITKTQSEMIAINNSLSQEKVSTTIKTLKASGNLLFADLIAEATKLYLDSKKQRSLTIVYTIINQLTALGKDCKYAIELAQQSTQYREQQHQQLTSQLQQIQDRINRFQQDIEQQKIFECDKIQGPCPYIDMINTVTFRKLDEQLQSFVRERDGLQLQIKQLTDSTRNHTNNLSDHQTALPLIMTALADLERKQIEFKTQEITKLQTTLGRFQQQRQILQEQGKNIQTLQEQSISLRATLSGIKSQVKSLENQISQINIQNIQITEQLRSLPGQDHIAKKKEQINTYQSTLDRLAQIISDYKSAQIEIKQLQEDEKVLADLYQIFARELLLIVVQKNLPLLQDLMNSYLSQVVDYQLQMEIDKKSATNDNIELFVTVLDKRGPREVKSLSGGQKVILKIVWMMAVSSLMRTQMLFLDETINNLDGDTVGKVAELLKNFVEGRGKEFMLYVVTHSHQIQEMSIWDEVVEIGQ